MRFSLILTSSILFLSGLTLNADDYLTKTGKLTHTLKVTQLQGGFAGVTGNEYTIEPDGAWIMSSVFKQKLTPKGNGKLTAKALESVAAVLSKNELDKLPEKTGKQPGANPFTLTIEYGKHKYIYVGQTAPKRDAGGVEARFAKIYESVAGTLKGNEIKSAPSE